MENFTAINGTTPRPLLYCNNLSNSSDLIGRVEKQLTLAYPLLLTICLISNTANLAIYQHKLLRSSTTIRMLCAKAIANMVNTLVMFPNFLKSVPQWADKRIINDVYWQGLPYMMFILNIFATFAIWLTLIVSIERYVMVAFPVQAKMWCNMRNTSIAIILSFLAAIALQTQSFVARKLYKIPCNLTIENTSWTKSYTYLYVVSKRYESLQTSYHYTYSISTIFVPMVIMILATLLINYHLFWASRTFASSAVEQKRCVTRLSLATTVSHVIFETPHFVIFIVAAISHHNEIEFWTRWDGFVGVANFLSVVNNSIPFFVYLLCSKRYRQIALVVLCRSSSSDLANNAFTKVQEHTCNNAVVAGDNSRSSYQGVEPFVGNGGEKKKKSSRRRRRLMRRFTTHAGLLSSTDASAACDKNSVTLKRDKATNGAGQPAVFVNGKFMRKLSCPLIDDDKQRGAESLVTGRATASTSSASNTGAFVADNATENTSLLELSLISTTDK